MTVLHAGYPQQQPTVTNFAHQHLGGGVVPRCRNSGVGGAYHLQHDENISGSGIAVRRPSESMMMMRRLSDASSEGSFENMRLSSRHVAYMGRDTDRFFGEFEDEFEVDDDDAMEDEHEPVSELVPLGGGTRRVPRTPRRKSTTKCGFYDFYKLTNEHLGAGAYGSVMTCTALATGLEYAVKIVAKNDETHSRHRILREVNIFKTCKNHPNIVQLVDWFEDEESFYLVMEKMRGGPLLQHILQRGYFTEEEARRVTMDIASALKFMHDRGIAHRDVKPENVLCTDPNHVSPVKLCDLDLASQRQPSSDRHERQPLCQVNSEPDLASPVGSAEFMAPEVVDAFVGDALKYDKKCDTWSLGVILYIMLAGYAPFQGECDDENCGWSDGQPCDDCQQDLFQRIQSGSYEFPEEEWSMISREAKDLVSGLLKRNPAERFNADQILSHAWIQQSAPSTILQTPSNLIYRKDSARDVQQMFEHFNVMNRFVAPRLSARMGIAEENGGATVTVHDGTFLTVDGAPFGSSSRRSSSPHDGEYTPPISRGSPTTPPPSMIGATAMESNDSGMYSMFSPIGSTSPLRSIDTIQLFGGNDVAKIGEMLNSVQLTPRLTAEDEEDSTGSFGIEGSRAQEIPIQTGSAKAIPRRIETEVNV